MIELILHPVKRGRYVGQNLPESVVEILEILDRAVSAQHSLFYWVKKPVLFRLWRWRRSGVGTAKVESTVEGSFAGVLHTYRTGPGAGQRGAGMALQRGHAGMIGGTGCGTKTSSQVVHGTYH